MKKQVLISLVLFSATAFAASGTYKVHISQDSVVEGKTVKAGDYKITFENGNAILKQGKQSIEVPAREETQANKAPQTELFYKDNASLQEIRIEGSRTKIVFAGGAPMQPGL